MFNRAYVEITDVCNLACSFCPGTRRPAGYMRPEDFRLLAEKLRGHTAYLYLHVMGEPLLHPQLEEILAIARQLDFRVCITTNGTLLPRRGHALAGVHKVSVSLHSFEGNDRAEGLEAYLSGVWDFCRRAAALPNLCPHFHLSLQSGCDATLHRMNRRYDTARFRQSVDLLRRYFDHPAITTDVICGFPQETEEEFSATLAFLEECRFAAMHVFPYSIRPGTKAADMPQVPGPVKEERAARAGALAARLHRAYLEECVGRTYPVLFEQPVAGRYGGHAPNYMEVAVSGGQDLHNRVLPVRITGTDGEILWGELE